MISSIFRYIRSFSNHHLLARSKYILCFFFGLLCLVSRQAKAVDQLGLFKTIMVKARLISCDELGNIYVVKTDNSLVRYSQNGDSTGFYKSVSNGDITSVDATNPLRVILYYSPFSKVVILDRMLAFKNELNLSQINLLKPSAVAASADGNLWVYDQFNARIRKVDDNLKEVGQSNDLRQQLQFVPMTSFMTERDRRLYVCDTAQGILVFDRYGNYVNSLSIYGVKYLQVYDKQLIYLHGDTLHSFNMETIASNIMTFPNAAGKLVQALIAGEKIFALYDDQLMIYGINKK